MWERSDWRIMYYNTTNETGKALIDHKATTLTQNELIYHLMMLKPQGYTPSDLFNHLAKEWNSDGVSSWPITSIRRALSTLTDAGKLTKTNKLRKGMYGKKEHIWRINPPFNETKKGEK